METTAQKIISRVQTLPVREQKEIIRILQQNLLNRNSSPAPDEEEIERILLAKNLISEIPQRSDDDEEETYQPIKISGNPLFVLLSTNSGITHTAARNSLCFAEIFFKLLGLSPKSPSQMSPT